MRTTPVINPNRINIRDKYLNPVSKKLNTNEMINVEAKMIVPAKLTLTPFLNFQTAENKRMITPTLSPLKIACNALTLINSS